MNVILQNDFASNVNVILQYFGSFYTTYEQKLFKIGIIRVFELLCKHMLDKTQEIAGVFNILVCYMRFVQNY